MKSKLKPGWKPRWILIMERQFAKSSMPWRRPKPSKAVEYTNYVRHQISKANRAVREGKTNEQS